MSNIFIVTNRQQTGTRSLLTVISQAVAGGADVIMLREKDLSSADLYRLAVQAKKLCTNTGTKIFINSNIEVALACDADGVHLGYGSLPVEIARSILPGKTVGISVHTLEEALEAQNGGADYVLAGHVFPTGSKPGRQPRGIAFINELSGKLTIPIIAIGGINPANARTVTAAGADGVAVMSVVMGADDVAGTIRDLRQAINP